MEIDNDQAQPFYDFNEPQTFDFDFEADYNAPVDAFPDKEPYAPLTDDGTFDSPSASPLPVVPEPLSFVPLPLEVSSHSDDGLFDAALPTEPMDMEPTVDVPTPPSAVQTDGSYDSHSDSETQNKRGRKRKAPAAPSVPKKKMRFEPGHVIPKEDLHTLSSEELEEYATFIQESNISAAEKNEIRKQLRLVKNRESAQASRLRKKNYIDDLERRVNELSSENSNLRQNVGVLRNENTQLKSEVVYLKGVVNNSGLSKVLSQGASFFSKLSQQQQQAAVNGKPATPVINPRAAGVVLMVVLFSVGLMFNSQLATPLPGRIAVTDSKQARVLNHANYKPTSEVRNVLSVLEQSEMPTQRIRQLVEKQRAMPDSASHKVLEERPAVAAASSKAEEIDASVVVPEWKANTTYFLCPEVQKLTPPADIEASSSPALPQQISFLIPQTALDAGDAAPRARGSSSKMIEVTCQVLDVVARPVSLGDATEVVA